MRLKRRFFDLKDLLGFVTSWEGPSSILIIMRLFAKKIPVTAYLENYTEAVISRFTWDGTLHHIRLSRDSQREWVILVSICQQILSPKRPSTKTWESHGSLSFTNSMNVPWMTLIQEDARISPVWPYYWTYFHGIQLNPSNPLPCGLILPEPWI